MPFLRQSAMRLLLPRSYQFLFACLLGVASFTSCADFEERDLAADRVALVAPSDGIRTSRELQTFVWDATPGADNYQLDVASPSFDTLEELIARIETSYLQQEVSLSPGQYTWRVTAFNSTSSVASEVRQLTVGGDSSETGFSGQRISLIDPEERAVVSDTSLSLSWTRLSAADEYQVQVANPSFADAASIAYDERVQTTTTTVPLSSDGEYRWRVRAFSDGVATPWTERRFTVDRSGPERPTNLQPGNRQSLLPPVELTWTSEGGIAYDSLFLRADSTNGRSIVNLRTNTSSYSVVDTSATQYAWRVRSFDAADNGSGYSDWQTFTVRR